jgi:mono/diheme cytochrome c family protein
MKHFTLAFTLAAIFLLIAAFIRQPEDPWKVPEKYAKMKNPVKADNASIMAGKEIYREHCTGCHGLNGKGFGKRSENLTVSPADFSADAFQKQTDGAILYKIYVGHSEMPGFKKKFPGNKGVSEDNFGKTRIPGDVVNFLRSFARN